MQLSRLRKLESAANDTLLRTREWCDIGPFRAYFDALSDLIWLNYAAPIATLSSERGIRRAMGELRDEFAQRRRRLRFEFIEPLWPELPAILVQQGLVLQAQQLLMICTLDDLQLRDAGEIRIREIRATHDDATLAMFERVAAEGFVDAGAMAPSSSASRTRLRVELQSGARRAVIGYIGDEPAGVAALSPMGAVAELVGVATRPRFRRRGVASLLSTYLAAEFFRHGGDVVWLLAGDAVAQATYRTSGFADAGVYANYIEADGRV